MPVVVYALFPCKRARYCGYVHIYVCCHLANVPFYDPAVSFYRVCLKTILGWLHRIWNNIFHVFSFYFDSFNFLLCSLTCELMLNISSRSTCIDICRDDLVTCSCNIERTFDVSDGTRHFRNRNISLNFRRLPCVWVMHWIWWQNKWRICQKYSVVAGITVRLLVFDLWTLAIYLL